jgi:hypothetical protein
VSDTWQTLILEGVWCAGVTRAWFVSYGYVIKVIDKRKRIGYLWAHKKQSRCSCLRALFDRTQFPAWSISSRILPSSGTFQRVLKRNALRHFQGGKMTARRYVMLFMLAIALATFILVPGFITTVAEAQGPDEAVAACATPHNANWKTDGNCSTNPPTHFLGTLDTKALVFKTNALERMRIDSAGKVGIGTTAPLQKLSVFGPDSRLRLESTSSAIWTTTEYKTNAREWHTGVGGSTVGNDVKSKYYIFDGTAGQFRMTIDTNGNVGIGTTAPNAPLSVVKSGAPLPNVQGVPAGLKVGTPSGTIPLALKQNGPESGTPGLAYFETSNGDLGYLGANTGTLVIGAAANKALGFNVNGSKRAMSIASNGVVGIGTTNIAATLNVRSSTASTGANVLRVENSNGLVGFRVNDHGTVFVALSGVQLGHVCYGNGGYLAECSSAAEYVPTIDAGEGFPETADLVSIAPAVKNPYGDTHGPFTVQKSATACDPNLLGFIADPKLGADGKKLNDHYLPLAIYGYFPAKVTMENGFIRRGDPLTSSSKPGYAMKATGACKTIGFALEDANTAGTIQVFADLGENAAGQVVGLEQRMQELEAQNASFQTLLHELKAHNSALEAENAALGARLAALEKSLAAVSTAANKSDTAVVTVR